MEQLIDLLPWYEKITFKKEITKALKKQPKIVDWNNCVNKYNLYEIVFTNHDVGLLSPDGKHIYSRYSPYHPDCEYGNVPVRDNLYFWYHSGIFLKSKYEWDEKTSQHEDKDEILEKFGYMA